jgi:hypothetical protein
MLAITTHACSCRLHNLAAVLVWCCRTAHEHKGRLVDIQVAGAACNAGCCGLIQPCPVHLTRYYCCMHLQVELIMVERDAAGQSAGQFSVGWAQLPLFSDAARQHHTPGSQAAAATAQLMSGTPRYLLFRCGDLYQILPSLYAAVVSNVHVLLHGGALLQLYYACMVLHACHLLDRPCGLLPCRSVCGEDLPAPRVIQGCHVTYQVSFRHCSSASYGRLQAFVIHVHHICVLYAYHHGQPLLHTLS